MIFFWEIRVINSKKYTKAYLNAIFLLDTAKLRFEKLPTLASSTKRLFFSFIFKTTASNVVAPGQKQMNADVDVAVLVESLSIVVESGKISLP